MTKKLNFIPPDTTGTRLNMLFADLIILWLRPPVLVSTREELISPVFRLGRTGSILCVYTGGLRQRKPYRSSLLGIWYRHSGLGKNRVCAKLGPSRSARRA